MKGTPPLAHPEQESELHLGKVPETDPKYLVIKKLEGKKVFITGGDSGIGKAVALLFASHGADIGFVYEDQHEDAQDTLEKIKQYKVNCWMKPFDLSLQMNCRRAVESFLSTHEQIDILINNVAVQYPTEDFTQNTIEQIDATIRLNLLSYLFITHSALVSMPPGSSIINTASVVAYRGSEHLVDYAASKGGIVSFTRSLALQLAKKHIRVNAVAPGPVWTPLISSTFPPEKITSFGAKVPLGREAQPNEIAPAYLFLAADESEYITGQVIHPNGGEIING